MIFCLRLKMRTDRAAAFHMWLLKGGRQIGIAPTSMTNDSDDVDLRNPDFQVYRYVCQAEAMLKPKQLVTLFAECQRIGAVVLGLVYQETDAQEEEEDSGSEQSWSQLVRKAERTPDPPVAVRRPRVTHLPVRLRMLQGGLGDDPDK